VTGVSLSGVVKMTDSISIPVWHKTPRGGWIRRDSLDADEVGSTYWYVSEVLKMNPKDFGIPNDKPYCMRHEEYIKADDWR